MCERGACVMERRRLLTGQIRGSKCTAPAPAAPRISAVFVSVLSRRCLGFCLVVVSVFVSSLSRLSRFCLAPPPNSLSPNGWRYRYIYIYRSLGEGCPNGKFSEERCVCVRARGLCDGEAAAAHWANPGLEVYFCCCFFFCSAPDLGRFCLGFVSSLSRLLSRRCLGCLGFVSVLSRFCLAPPPPNSLSPNGWRYRYIYKSKTTYVFSLFIKTLLLAS